ncbi:ABC transporter ATP-binding protein [Listeria floridensis FSL S10-1187]|uniref:ABC transporter ATP-binding protein n=1 Tax=Listeria floridensis FSL S10-1187 TaxID=1265817 RepID=A0ABN0REV8_9LIST|nr:ABC-F family ATP-binding cassette domain-containing protein [Listeria floridensis]EUJ31684.1 ABC transporter ATP-binding protein [Listeria floridensis FSL S10-1187]
MKIVDLNQVTKNFAGDLILDQISMQIGENERVGLIGRNGEGKSTILKIIAGIEPVNSGSVTWKKDAKIGLLRQIQENLNGQTVEAVLERSFAELLQMKKQMTQLEKQMTEDANDVVMERYGDLLAQFAERGGYEMQADIEKVMRGLGIEVLRGKLWDDLSGGEKTKTALAALLLEKPDLLLLDEPTNHLDLTAVIWLTKFLQTYRGAVLVVSHDRYFLDEVVTKMIELENMELITYHTNFSGYLKEREERLLREFQAYKDQQKKIKKMKQAIKQLREWGEQANPPNDAFFRRAKNMERMLEKMEKVKRPVLTQKEMNLEFEESKRSGDDVVVFEGVSKRFGEKILLDAADLHIRHKDRVAIIGDNGTGKSTLLKMIVGTVSPDAGEVLVGTSAKIAYLSQQMEELDPNLTVLEAFRDRIGVTEGEARNMLAGFMFYREMVFRKVANLSGGERMRLRLAQFINQPVNTLVLDEPTNHLDIASREVLEEAISKFNGTVITVSHDRYFIDQICSKILLLSDKKLTLFHGNYTYFAKKVK